MKKFRNIYHGEILMEEFLFPLELSAYRLSKDNGIPQTRISEILKGNRRITADTALRLFPYFGNSAKFWLGLQDDYDIEEGSLSKSRDQFNNSLPKQRGITAYLHKRGSSSFSWLLLWYKKLLYF